jgi:hypothetical protein
LKDSLYFRSHLVKRNARLKPMATRKYEQWLRAESAEETRRRILDAVCQRLRSAPAEPVSIEVIARMARVSRVSRVSRSTVYLVFGSRAGLFCAPGADLLERGGFGGMLAAASHPPTRARHCAAGSAAWPECTRPTATCSAR